jgi:F0F1-type ATP synthase delta subunit
MKALKYLTAFVSMASNDAREIVNHYAATVWSAIPLAASERQALEKSLAAKLKGTIDLEEKVDPGIIGGLIVETGGWRYDARVKGICDRLKFALYAS